MRPQPKFKPQTKRLIYNALATDEEKLAALEEHHKAETEELMNEIERLRKIINDEVENRAADAERSGYPW